MPDPRKTKNSELAELIAAARVARGLDVRTAAEQFGCSPQQWRNFESGANRPPLARLESLADLLGLDLAATFSCWVTEHLEAESPRLRDLLGRWGNVAGTPHYTGSRNDAAEQFGWLENRLAELPLDETASRFAFSIAIESLRHASAFRKSLIQPAKARIAYPDVTKDLQNPRMAEKWQVIKGMKRSARQLIAFSRVGLGYIAAVIRIQPGYAIYHKDQDSPYQDSGMEFFSILHGSGVGFLQNEGNDWDVVPIRASAAGAYAAHSGHGILNNHETDALYVMLVAVPFNPKSQLLQRPHTNAEGTEFVGALEFTLAELRRESTPLPYKLKNVLLSANSHLPSSRRAG